ncbi:hypothetical protein ACIQGZ_02700 [Streptomyces sp. NPDC092296]|uniref:hypothetical protein n=1 Tax=Streptomyces sp. NPDC092296 TaxID=3366012 RepID=UPI0037FBDC60
MTTIYRGPDGRHWEETGDRFDEKARQWMHELTAASQDPGTGRWAAADHGDRVEVAGPVSKAGYTEVSADPLGEPRFARVHAIVAELLADFDRQAGHPHPRTAELHVALEDLAVLPEQIQRRGRGAAAQAARSAYHRGARRRY